MSFTCPGYEPTDEAVRAREARQARVEALLLAHPEHRYALDVADAPLKAGPPKNAATTAAATPVSIVLAVRHGEQILSGAILIPRERGDLQELIETIDHREGAP